MAERNTRNLNTTAQLPEACAPARRIIEEAAHWVWNVSVFLEEGDEGYEGQQAALDECLRSARQACADKPEGCYLTGDDGDRYRCVPCDFEVDIT